MRGVCHSVFIPIGKGDVFRADGHAVRAAVEQVQLRRHPLPQQGGAQQQRVLRRHQRIL